MLETAASPADATASRCRAEADGRLSPRHRGAHAQRRQDHLRCARHPDHGLRPPGAGRGHPRHLVPARAARRQRRGHRRLPDEEARHLPHGVRARLPQRSDGAGQCDDQLLSDDPDQRLVRARDRRPAAGRLRRDGPTGDCQAALQGGVPRAACRGHRHRRGARDPRRGFRPSGRRLSRSAGQTVRSGDRRGGRSQNRSSRSSTRRRPSFPRRPRSRVRSIS